jgi:glutathione S-transferase
MLTAHGIPKEQRTLPTNTANSRVKPNTNPVPQRQFMKIHIFPPSGRVVGIVALKNYLALDCDLQTIDLGKGNQRTAEYAALNLNRKMPTLEDDGIVLWESNAILFYIASKRPESGVWPRDVKHQSDVLRWLFWESAHWDPESLGMVAYEKASKDVLGLGPPDAAFIARGEQNFSRSIARSVL